MCGMRVWAWVCVHAYSFVAYARGIGRRVLQRDRHSNNQSPDRVPRLSFLWCAKRRENAAVTVILRPRMNNAHGNQSREEEAQKRGSHRFVMRTASTTVGVNSRIGVVWLTCGQGRGDGEFDGEVRAT